MAEAEVIKLVSSDGVPFETTVDLCKWSKTISNLVEDCSDLGEIPLSNVHSKLIPKILEFFKHYVENPPDKDKHRMSGGNVTNTELTDFDKEWVPSDKDELAEYILAANYLECFEMLNVCIQTTANMIKGKTVAELQEFFNVPDEEKPTDEEVEEIKKTHAYLLPDEEQQDSASANE